MVKKLKRRIKIWNLNRRLKKKVKRRKKLVESPLKPRYDEVYFEGLKWLDRC